MDQPQIYTDGSCLKNPGGAGGWAFTLLENGKQWTMSGGVESTTNNRMELQAIIEALYFAQGPTYVINTDSEVTMKCAKLEYRRNSNKDLWLEYEKARNNREINWNWIKAHIGNSLNEYVDRLAREEAEFLKK